jgi:hypothetical protein
VINGSEFILVWYIRGLNAQEKRNVIGELVAAENTSILCIQETKLDVISDFDVMQLCGFSCEYFSLPAVHTHGGILVAWCVSSWEVFCCSVRSYSISTKFKHHLGGGDDRWLTTVYDPANDAQK